MSESPIQHVSDTAFMVAAYRALESERPDPLFRDPLAARLVGERGRKIVENLPRWALLVGWSVVIRTYIIDQFIQAAIAEGVDTILNLGTGLDTRPYRMDLPASLRWVEVDFPDVIDLKESKLAGEAPRCRLVRVKLDLADAAQREKFLSEVSAHSQKTLVLTEGVIPYLKPEEVAALARDLKSNSAFCYRIADYFSRESYRFRRRQGMTQAMKKAPFRFEPDDFFGFFRELGWQPKVVRYIPEEADRLRRPVPLPWPMLLWYSIASLFMSAERRAVTKRYMGYVLFEPLDLVANEQSLGSGKRRESSR
ncbi:MAG: SAM-dependent methyltransferase [Chthoniobacter sp.]|uniref:class I SAM-dependent methyltransferase n=1 Tax=Chthoniobacter sp. TaxID=2510640 RepID=UPI0032A27544